MSFIGKTKTLLGLNALQNLVSDSMAIDMGSASTIIAVRGRGVVVDEPSVVAVNKVTGEVIAVGDEAHKMQGREARDVMVIAPLVDGVVADFERTRTMLDYFVRAARSDHERAFGSNAGRATRAAGGCGRGAYQSRLHD